MDSVPLESKAFRETLGLFATGVTVIAAEVEGKVHAMTANGVCSLSLDPMLVLFCVAKRARFSAVIARAKNFSINILREEQQSLSTYFASGWKDATPPPFRFVVTHATPRLEGSLAALLCTKQAVHEGGDHWLAIMQVQQLHRGIEPYRPLLFFRSRYHQLDRQAGTAGPDLVSTADEPAQMYYHD